MRAGLPGVRVLFWSELFWPYIGGNEMVAAKLLPALRRRGHEFSVVTSHQSLDLPDQDEYQGIPLRRFPFRAALASRSIEAITALRQDVTAFVDRLAPDIIHVSCVGASSYFVPLWSAVGATAPLLAHLHSEVLPSQGPGHDSILRRVLERAQYVVSVSHAVLAQGIDVVPSVRRRSAVIPNAMEEPPTLPARLPYDPPCVLCLGRLVPEKGFDVALRVFAQVRERVPSARFLIAGDGVERPRLEQQARELDLGDRVEFLGWVRPGEVPALINRATLVLMPSRRESFSLVAIETAHMARPTVATRAAGLAEVVVDGETGLLVAKEDVPALSHAVLTLLGHPDLARRMGHAARQRARELFNLPRCVGRFDELYRRLVWGRREAVGLAVHP